MRERNFFGAQPGPIFVHINYVLAIFKMAHELGSENGDSSLPRREGVFAENLCLIGLQCVGRARGRKIAAGAHAFGVAKSEDSKTIP